MKTRRIFGSLLATAFAAARHLPKDTGRTYVSAAGWPRRGQAAFVLGNGRPAVSPPLPEMQRPAEAA